MAAKPNGPSALTAATGRTVREASNGMRLTRSTIITGVALLVLLAATLSAIPETLRSWRLYLLVAVGIILDEDLALGWSTATMRLRGCCKGPFAGYPSIWTPLSRLGRSEFFRKVLEET